jgi:RHS repeat-associated protein
MASTQITQRCTYRYDPLDRLINQTQPDTPTHQRFYCKSRLATEIQGATKHSIIQHDDLLLAQQQREGDTLDTTLLITDLQRSVLHTLKKATQPQPIAYSPYGHRPAFNGLLSLLGFNGERPDPVTGHYLLGNGYRAFNPVLMRFNSPDSWSPFGKGGTNSYMFCLGNPINRIDQTGHFSVAITKRISAWISRTHYSIRAKLLASGKLKLQWEVKPIQSMQDSAIDSLVKNPLAFRPQNTPPVLAKQIIQRIGIENKANSIKFPPRSMQSHKTEKLATNRELTTTPEATIGLSESSDARYSLYNQMRFALRPDDEPKTILSRIRSNDHL